MVNNRGKESYRKWREAVLERDGHMCQFPGCHHTDKLQIHHIKKFAKARHLRTETFNGITLCLKCHQNICNREQQYEVLFFTIVKNNIEKQQKE